MPPGPIVNYKQLSKRLSHALRHAPEKYGLALDDEGRVPLSILIPCFRALRPEWSSLSREDLVEMLNRADKKRFEISGTHIRALYGHSTDKVIEMVEGVPPERLYHGTSSKAVERIQAEGLRPMSRQYVHLAQYPQLAIKTGERKTSKVVLLTIATEKAVREGTKFFDVGSGIWLATRIPSLALCEIRFEPL